MGLPIFTCENMQYSVNIVVTFYSKEIHDLTIVKHLYQLKILQQ